MIEVVVKMPQRALPARCAAPVLILSALMLSPCVAGAQAQLDTVGTRAGSVGVHALAGAFGGRLDMHRGPVSELIGGRAGIGLGEVLELTGFYWRGIDRAERELQADQAFGGEARLALNAGFGIAPFLSGGVARMELVGAPARTAALAGAGLSLPIGPVLLSATAQDYILGVTGLDRAGVADVSHNWLLGVGVTIGFGRGRRAEPITVARPATTAPLVAGTPAQIEAAAEQARAAGVPLVVTQEAVVRNYQSDRTIEVPIPTEGSITLRYGPERTVTGDAIAGDAAPRRDVAGAPSAPLQGTVGPASIAALTQDPLLQAWLRQAIGQELALQLRGMPIPGAAPAAQQAPLVLGGDLTAAGLQRALDNVMATMLLRIEAGEAQRMNLLREDLRQALASQAELMRREIARLEGRVTGAPLAAAPPAAQPPAAAPPVAAPPLAAVPPAAVQPPAETPPAGQVDPAVAARVAAAQLEADIRLALADAAALHPQLLGTAETVRGPAVVLSDVAFVQGAPLVGDQARPALRRVAEIIRAQPDRVVYVHGHSDGDGPELQNQRLSELRAETVRSLLVQEGIDPGRVFAIGFGEGRPIADNATPAGRALNRRVEIVVGDARAGLDPQAGIRPRLDARRAAMEEQNR
jgi:outer membrane protein OmpA-like peptidoglycan-associated protein